MDGLYDYFFHVKCGNSFSVLDFLAGLFSSPEAISAEVIIRPLEVISDQPLNVDRAPSLCFSLLAFPSPLITLIACKINYQSCHILHC